MALDARQRRRAPDSVQRRVFLLSDRGGGCGGSNPFFIDPPARTKNSSC